MLYWKVTVERTHELYAGEVGQLTRQQIRDTIDFWKIGYRTIMTLPKERRQKIFVVVESVKANLIECGSLNELVEKYSADKDWCLKVAEQVRPHLTWRSGLHTVVDAAFYLRACEIKYR